MSLDIIEEISDIPKPMDNRQAGQGRENWNGRNCYYHTNVIKYNKNWMRPSWHEQLKQLPAYIYLCGRTRERYIHTERLGQDVERRGSLIINVGLINYSIFEEYMAAATLNPSGSSNGNWVVHASSCAYLLYPSLYIYFWSI